MYMWKLFELSMIFQYFLVYEWHETLKLPPELDAAHLLAQGRVVVDVQHRHLHRHLGLKLAVAGQHRQRVAVRRLAVQRLLHDKRPAAFPPLNDGELAQRVATCKGGQGTSVKGF